MVRNTIFSMHTYLINPKKYKVDMCLYVCILVEGYLIFGDQERIQRTQLDGSGLLTLLTLQTFMYVQEITLDVRY